MWQYSKPKAFHDKAYERGKLAKWDARWHELSPQARVALLNDVKGRLRTKVTAIPAYPLRSSSQTF